MIEKKQKNIQMSKILSFLHEIFFNVHNDAPLPWQIGFQDGASPEMIGIIDFHNGIFFFLVVISLAVFWILGVIVYFFNSETSPIVYKYLTHGTLIELVWTITPAIILMFIAQPSFNLLYILDEVISPTMTIKAVGFFKNLWIIYLCDICDILCKNNLELGGLKLCILNKITDTYNLGQKNINGKLQSSKSKSLGLNKFHTRVKAINRIGPHNEEVLSVIVGSLLGDCNANKRCVEGTRLVFKQSIVHKDYLFWLFNFFNIRGYCSNLEPRKYTRKLKITLPQKIESSKKSNISEKPINYKIKEYHGFEFNTFTFRSFDWIYKLFYRKGKKRIDSKILNYLTPLALTVWIMDDGGKAGNGVRISTNSYSLKEVETLVLILKSKFDLESTIQKITLTRKKEGQYSIYIKSKSIPTLKKVILPYLHKSMNYKLGL